MLRGPLNKTDPIPVLGSQSGGRDRHSTSKNTISELSTIKITKLKQTGHREYERSIRLSGHDMVTFQPGTNDKKEPGWSGVKCSDKGQQVQRPWGRNELEWLDLSEQGRD